MSDMDEVLARFHQTLVVEIQARRPEYLQAPFTVAEIYQNLVPYGSHRDSIGVEMNGDYEDALLRLLAGEGGYLILESAPALRALRNELESSNPNTGLYREFAAVDVHLDPARIPGGGAPQHQVPVEAAPWSMADLAPEAHEVPKAPPPQAAQAEDDGSAGSEACRWCRAALPHRAGLNFCPFCGTGVHVVPCPACGKELEPDWRFCFACGTEVAS